MEKMKIKTVCLIRVPNYLLWDEKLQTPLGILSIASYLREKNIPVYVCDLAGEPKENWVKLIPDNFDIYGVSATTGDFMIACKVAKVIKREINPEALLVIGGAHVSSLPEKSLWESDFDVAVIGEGEQTIYELATGEKFLPQGIAFKVKGESHKICITDSRPLCKNLDSLPFPAWDLIPDLISYDLVEKGQPATCITGSRGCNQRCAFCDQGLFNYRYRRRSPENILDEIRSLKDRYHIKEVRFVDELVGVNIKRLERLCLGMKELGIKWRTHMRANHITPEKCKIMADGGCVELAIGVESANQEILDLVNKRIKIKQVEETVKYIKDSGMKSKCYFIVGLPGETWYTVETSMKWIARVNPDKCTLSTFCPYPGSDIYKHPNRYGYRLEYPDDWWRYWILGYENTDEPFVGSTREMSNDELVKARNIMLKFLTDGGWKDKEPEGHRKKVEKAIKMMKGEEAW
jgi:radical SAM superfamily enzyme YgiQ (UPF0313 family)